MSNMVEIQGLKKAYGQVRAVNGIDFFVKEGQLYAFLGPNGAGKSTTIHMLCTFLKPDAGRVRVNGYELGREDGEIRRSIGVVFQEGLLDKLLTVEENLRTRARFYAMGHREEEEAFREAVRAVGAEEFLKRPYGRLSGGQRRRADIARALIHRPRLLILDEPTTGLDPQTRGSVWEMIRRLQRENGMTVFLTTHYMEEAAVADYVTVMDHGCLTAAGTPMELKEAWAQDRLRLSPKEGCREALEQALLQLGVSWTPQSGGLTAAIPDTLSALPVIRACEPYLAAFEVLQGTMDDAFVQIIERKGRKEKC